MAAQGILTEPRGIAIEIPFHALHCAKIMGSSTARAGPAVLLRSE